MRRRSWSAFAGAFVVAICSWNLASASTLTVDGGTLQYWELDAEVPIGDARSAPEAAAPEGLGSEVREPERTEAGLTEAVVPDTRLDEMEPEVPDSAAPGPAGDPEDSETAGTQPGG